MLTPMKAFNSEMERVKMYSDISAIDIQKLVFHYQNATIFLHFENGRKEWLKDDLRLVDLLTNKLDILDANQDVINLIQQSKCILPPFGKDQKLIKYYDHIGKKHWLLVSQKSVSLNGFDQSQSLLTIITEIQLDFIKAEQFIELLNDLRKSFHKETLDLLSKRELEILREIGNGLSGKEISEKLFISVHTVKTHRENLCEKLAVKKSTKLAQWAEKLGLLDA